MLTNYQTLLLRASQPFTLTLFGRNLRQIRCRSFVATIANKLNANAMHTDCPIHEITTVLKVLNKTESRIFVYQQI